MKPLNVALIGCGSRGRSHLEAIKDFEDIRVNAVCDFRESAAKETAVHFGASSVYTSIENMLDTEMPDMVIVATPAHINAECAMPGIERGIHTLMEKPPGLSEAETRELSSAANKSGSKVLVGWNRRFHDIVVQSRKLIEERGPIVQITAEFHKSMSRLLERSWPEHMKDNFIYETPIHAIDLLRVFADSPVAEVYPAVRRAYSKYVDVHAAMVVFENGCVAQFSANYTTDARLERYEIHGRDCSACLEGIKSGVVFRDGERIRLKSRENGTAAQARHLISAIQNDKPIELPAASLSEAVKTMNLVDRIRGGLMISS